VTRPGRLPRIPRPTEHGHRAPISSCAVTACFDAHQADTHAGEHNPECSTCNRYAAALTHTRTRTHTTRTRP
jgi:hypothetical protein